MDNDVCNVCHKSKEYKCTRKIKLVLQSSIFWNYIYKYAGYKMVHLIQFTPNTSQLNHHSTYRSL
jgi:hypothetical protein